MEKPAGAHTRRRTAMTEHPTPSRLDARPDSPGPAPHISSTILVTGGTGTLGRLVVAQLQSAGYDVRVLSRHPRPATDGVEYFGADLTTGAGVDPAVAGAEVIVHCAGSSQGDADKTLNLVRAASHAR